MQYGGPVVTERKWVKERTTSTHAGGKRARNKRITSVLIILMNVDKCSTFNVQLRTPPSSLNVCLHWRAINSIAVCFPKMC
jgi:hypothetical protein